MLKANSHEEFFHNLCACSSKSIKCKRHWAGFHRKNTSKWKFAIWRSVCSTAKEHHTCATQAGFLTQINDFSILLPWEVSHFIDKNETVMPELVNKHSFFTITLNCSNELLMYLIYFECNKQRQQSWCSYKVVYGHFR